MYTIFENPQNKDNNSCNEQHDQRKPQKCNWVFSKIIRNYLKSRNIKNCIPKRNYKTKCNGITIPNHYNKTRFVVERFFAWLKNGFHRTRIRYERIVENYLAFASI